MRLIPLITAALLLLQPGPSFAQSPPPQSASPAAAGAGGDWIEFGSPADFFSVNFPGQPQVADITYNSEYRPHVAGPCLQRLRGQTVTRTVVDYSNAEKMHVERAAKCKAAGGDGDSCGSPGRADVRGAIVHRRGLHQEEVRDDPFRQLQRGPRRRASAAAAQSRWVTDVRRHPHA